MVTVPEAFSRFGMPNVVRFLSRCPPAVMGFFLHVEGFRSETGGL